MDARAWLDGELGRIWLVAELCLRQLQAAKLRPQATGDLAAILASRAEGRASDMEALTARWERVDREVVAARAQAPIGALAQRLGLSRLEVEVLIFAVAPHIDPPLAELFHAVRGVRRGVNLALVTQLLRLGRDDRAALLAALDPERPLTAWRLLEIGVGDTNDGSAANRALVPTFAAIELLNGVREPSSSIRRHAELVTAAATLDDLVLPAGERIALQRLCMTVRGGDAPWTVLWGLEGAGKQELAARIAAHAGQALLAVDLLAADKPARPELLRLAQRDALALGAALYLGPLPPISDEIGELVRKLAQFRGAVILGVESSQAPRLKIPHAVREVALALPTEQGRLALWQRGGVAQGLEELARGYHLTPGEILAVTAEATAIASGERRAPTHHDLRAGIDRRLRNGLQDIAWRVDVTARWEDLVLTVEDRDRIEEFVARRVFASTVYGDWGFGNRLERGKGSIALFSGPPGTGKTMLAGLVARGLGLELYQVDISQVQSRWVGETEKQLGRLFDLAERAHAVLLFDEADSLLAKRTDVESSNDRYANANVNYLLQRLEQYSGVAILTTNRDTALDDALQRRLSLHLRLDVPEVAERERLWQSFLPAAAPRERQIDLGMLARDYELTGGYIKNVVVRAAFLAAREQRKLGTALLRRAAVLEMEDMGRVVHAR